MHMCSACTIKDIQLCGNLRVLGGEMHRKLRQKFTAFLNLEVSECELSLRNGCVWLVLGYRASHDILPAVDDGKGRE